MAKRSEYTSVSAPKAINKKSIKLLRPVDKDPENMVRADFMDERVLLFVLHNLNNTQHAVAQKKATAIRDHALIEFDDEIKYVNDEIFSVADAYADEDPFEDAAKLTSAQAAAIFYSRYAYNRDTKDKDVARFLAHLNDGTWNVNEESNVFVFAHFGGRTNVLNDGHHRLVAYIAFGSTVPMKMKMKFNVLEENTRFTDTHTQRTPAQSYAMRNLDTPDAGDIEKFAKRRMSIETCISKKRKLDWIGKMSREDVLEAIDNNKTLYRQLESETSDCVKTSGSRIVKGFVLKKPTALALYHQLRQQVGQQTAHAMVHNIYTAKTYQDLHPVLAAVHECIARAPSDLSGNKRSIYATELLIGVAKRFKKDVKNTNIKLPKYGHTYPLVYFTEK